MRQEYDLDLLGTQIENCGSAAGLYEACKEIRYQVKARPDETGVGELHAAYEIVKSWCCRLAGVSADAMQSFDELVDRDLGAA